MLLSNTVHSSLYSVFKGIVTGSTQWLFCFLVLIIIFFIVRILND